MHGFMIDYLGISTTPKSHPEELNNINLCDRLNQLEQRLSSMQLSVDGVIADNSSLHEKVNHVFSYATVEKTIMSPTLHSSVAIRPMKDKANVNTRDAKSTQKPNRLIVSNGPSASDNTCGVKMGGPSVPSKNIETSSENRKLAVVDSSQGEGKGPSSQTQDFQMPMWVRRKQARNESRQKRVITGMCHSDSVKGAPERTKDLFIYRVDPSTDLNHLRQDIQNRDFNIHNLERISKPGSKYSSYKLTVPMSQFGRLFDSDIWPNGLHVQRFVPPQKDRVNNG